jgi:hypothetical protein
MLFLLGVISKLQCHFACEAVITNHFECPKRYNMDRVDDLVMFVDGLHCEIDNVASFWKTNNGFTKPGAFEPFQLEGAETLKKM